MRALLLAALLTGCAGTSDVLQTGLEETARGLTALHATYHAECDGREASKHCIGFQEGYNLVLGGVMKINDKAAPAPTPESPAP